MTTTAVLAGPTWEGGAPAVAARAVVVAPHPDDEILGTGLLLRWLDQIGVPTVLVAVTDGEASHARSTLVSPEVLRAVRACERARALAVLGVDPVVERLGLPDGGVTGQRRRLADALTDRVDAATTLIAPWRHDGHPDHDACGRAAAVAAARTGATLWEVPIWARIRAVPASAHGARRLVADPVSAAAKEEAAACFGSQIRPLGPRPEDGPVVHPHELAAALAGPELVRCG